MNGGEERAMADSSPQHDRGSPNAAAGTLEKLPFELEHGERIIRELKPRFFGFMVTRSFDGYLGVLALIIAIVAVLVFLRNSLAGFLGWLLLLPAFVLLLFLAVSLKPLIQYGKSWYWITNHRVIGKRGLMGYSIDSIPLENVTDIVLTRTLLDRVLGLSSLIIVPMGGNSREEGNTARWGAQSPNFFPALTQETARELQRVLFNLRDDLKRVRQVSSAVSTPGISQRVSPETAPD
jgi:membrane protein YdbS with pleckstrin-like domain